MKHFAQLEPTAGALEANILAETVFSDSKQVIKSATLESRC